MRQGGKIISTQNNALLPILHDGRHERPPSVTCCIGYDLKKWRYKRLSKYVLDSIPEFVLTPEEISELDVLEPYSSLERSIPFFTNPTNPSAGGEVGELLAHRILKRDFGTEQLVKRLHYKMRSRDAVTGFDIVHFKLAPSDRIELWLGEAKFIANRSSAISKAIASLGEHIDEGVLTERKALIGPKIARNHPSYGALQWLFDPDTRLDEIISRLIVPVFIASDTQSANAGHYPDAYEENVKSELDNIVERVQRAHGSQLEFVFIYVPLNTKIDFDKDLTSRLAAFS